MKIEVGNLLSAISIVLDIAEGRIQHATKTAYTALRISQKLNIDESFKKKIYYASFLHDIGISLSTSQFYKAHVDFSLAKSHSEIGYEVVKKLPLDEDISELVRYHHEAFNGQGPFGLSNGDIPFGSQIITLADQLEIYYDKSIPYYLQVNEIEEWIVKNRGVIFNPDIVDAFLEISSTDKFWLDFENSNLRYIINDIAPKGELYFDLEKMSQFAQAMSIIIDKKSSFTNEHSINLQSIAYKIVKDYGFDYETCEKVKIAAYLHDIGKLVVPNEILDKPGNLTKEEFNIIKSHSYYTKIILNQIPPFNGEIAEWAANHHEKVDGSGYPERLDGKSLSLLDRIIGISDVYQALTEDRPYRKGMPQSKAFEIIHDMVKNNKFYSEEFELLKKAVS
ncbi:HD-GYP domain-containing protein [Caldicellulosiruptoraceae bacterium PP1]